MKKSLSLERTELSNDAPEPLAPAASADVLARKHAQGSEERFSTIFNHAAVGIAQTDLQGRYVLANQHFCNLVGRTPEQLYQLRIDDITHPDDVARNVQILEQLINHGVTHADMEKRFVRADGSVIWVLVTYACVRNERGQPEYVLAVSQDITARHNAEEELRRANEDLRQFAFAASHDLQEPLRMISNYTQLLLRKFRGRMDEDTSTFADYIRQGTERMAELLDDLLSYTSLSAVTGTTARLVDLQDIFGRVVENLRTAIAVNAAHVTSDPLPSVRGHESHFVQLFQNLIGNSLKYRSEAPPSVHVSVVRQDNQFLFGVHDNGIGIDPAYHTSIFGVFKRLHRSDIPGTGIGLAICQRVVERYGGKIWVESQPGKGATFYFTLPAPAHSEPPA